jgi:hypothetical protein
MKYAFRCRTCGRLEESAAAGERETPAACRSCGAGVTFNTNTGAKEYHPENWDVLAELPAGERDRLLKFHRLEASAIGTHKPARSTADREPQDLDRSAAEAIGAEDKTR